MHLKAQGLMERLVHFRKWYLQYIFHKREMQQSNITHLVVKVFITPGLYMIVLPQHSEGNIVKEQTARK